MEHWLPEGLAARLGPLGRYELRALLFGLALVLIGVPFGVLLQQPGRAPCSAGFFVRHEGQADPPREIRR